MSKHLFGLVVTHHGTAANNRGENEGNITTLQKILWNGGVHTTVSAEAIRWAIRYHWQRSDIEVNRKWNSSTNDHEWQDSDWLPWTDPKGKGKGKATYIDDDVLGFMLAEAAKTEANEGEATQVGAKKPQPRVNKRRGALEVTRAISLTPFGGDITFNAKSGVKTSTSLYGTEVHATRYQYGFALTPESLVDRKRALKVVDAIVSLSEVAGNQARFLFDFSPDSVIFRWTDDFAPRFLYGFGLSGNGSPAIPAIMRSIDAGDIDPKELVIGGSVVTLPEVAALKQRGTFAEPGVKSAAEEAKKRISEALQIK